MPLDVLLLGPIAFTDYSPPERMPFGGRQQMAVHKLIGGQSVIDTLGPDDEDIQWSGRFFGAGALSTCLALDSLRAAGQVLPLSYAGMGYTVVIQDFRADIRRLPLWVEYEIRCVVSTNGAHGLLGAIAWRRAGLDTLTNERRAASAPVSLFRLPQLSPRANIDARRFETVDASYG
jgi:hypothetical protein